MAKQIEAVEFNLSPAEEAAAQRIYESLKGKADQQLLNMVRMLAAKEPRELLGRAQFELRDMLNELGANVLQASTQESLKKGGTSS
jgi:uncharacterized protein HemY